tara:strand:- start:46 stop:1353 length:1308 start_codon:yes stop_codon:yes gene_type:complete
MFEGDTQLTDMTPAMPDSTINMFGVNTDNPSLNTFGVLRNSFRNPSTELIPPVLPESPANMDPMTRTLSQAMIPQAPPVMVDYEVGSFRDTENLMTIVEDLNRDGVDITLEELAKANDLPVNPDGSPVDPFVQKGKVLKVPVQAGVTPPTEFMDAETKAMLDEMTPVNASYTVAEGVANSLRPFVRPDIIKNKSIQKNLFDLGYVEVGVADGIIGYNTKAALRNFQKENGLPVTGKADKETVKKLNSIDIKNESLEKKMERQIRHHEGTVPYPYKDSLGLWTIGNGHLIGDGSDAALEKSGYKKYTKKNPMPSSELTKIFKKDLNEHRKIAESYPFYNKMTEEGKRAMLDLTFNMGDFLNKKKPNGELVWKNLRAQLEAGNFEGAADNLASSLYARQVGDRAVTVTNLLRQADPNRNKSARPKIRPLGSPKGLDV